jgi:hypothetical protein
VQGAKKVQKDFSAGAITASILTFRAAEAATAAMRLVRRARL